MAAPGPGASMALEDFLRSVLQTTGPNAMPYAPPARWDIQQQLQQLQQVFPSMAVRASDYHANDGRLLHLLKADGTIPIHYQGNKYNIPIVIWLTARFPDEAPLAYVTPTPTMVIKSPHQYVDRNGQVSCDALRNWKRQGSNLVDLCLDMSHVFGVDPPLYSQPPSAANPAARPVSGPLPTTQPPQGYPGYGFGSTNPPYGNAQQVPTPAGGSGSTPGLRPSSNPPSTTMPSYQLPGQASSSFQPPGASAANPDIATLAAANPLWGAAFASTLPGSKPQYPGQGPGLTPGGPSTSSDGPGRSNTPPTPAFPGSLFGQAMMNQQQQQQQAGYPPAGYADGAYGMGRPPPPPPPQKSDLEARFRPLALQALKLQVEAAQTAWAACVAAETNEKLEEQRALSERRAQLQAMVNGLKAERIETEGLVSEMGGKQAQLVAWLSKNESKAAAWRSMTEGGAAIAWDKVLPAADELCTQALETQAIDLAAEDTVLALDKALQAGLAGLTADAYLKQVRALCRKQFFARALALKVADAQRLQPVPSPRPGPAPPMSRPMPMSHGDTWAGYPSTDATRSVGRR